jgi:hypothetical protein
MRTIKILSLSAIVLCIGVVIWLTSSTGLAQKEFAESLPTCSTENMAGSYAYAAFGSVAPGSPSGFPAGPYNTLARLVMDGKGNYTVTGKTSYNGTLVDETFGGTYEVGEGCGVTYYLGETPVVFAYFNQTRKEARSIWTVPGLNISGLTIAQ